MLKSRFIVFLYCLVVSSASLLANAQTHRSGEVGRILTTSDAYLGIAYLNKDLQGGSGLLGWDFAFSTSERHGLRAKAEITGYSGTDNGAPQSPRFYLIGQEFQHGLLGNNIFVHGLVGLGRSNSNWLSGYSVDQSALAYDIGGGLDKVIAGPVAWRSQVDYLHAQFDVKNNAVQGLPTSYVRFSTGVLVRF